MCRSSSLGEKLGLEVKVRFALQPDKLVEHLEMPISDWVPLAVLLHRHTAPSVSRMILEQSSAHRKTSHSERYTEAATRSPFNMAASMNRQRPLPHVNQVYEAVYDNKLTAGSALT